MPAHPESDKLLLTVAGAKQSTALLDLLSGSWENLRLAVHSDASSARLRASFPGAEIVKADLNDATAVEALVRDVNVIFHLGPPFHPRETEVGLQVVAAAVAENRRRPGAIKHFVFSSVIGTQLRKLLNHDCKRPVEEALMESGLPYTILQPTHRMDMLPLKAILAQQPETHGAPLAYEAAWRPEHAMSLITMRDQVAATAVVLNEQDRHFYATYQLVSTPRPIPYAEFVKRAVRQGGKDVEVTYKGFQQSVDFYLKMLFDGTEPDTSTKEVLERMLLYYNTRGLLGNPNQLEWLLGRKGQTVEEWAQGQLVQ